MNSPLYPEAVEFTQKRLAEGRPKFSRYRFQRLMRVGFVTRDSLLQQLEDSGHIRRTDVDYFEVTQ